MSKNIINVTACNSHVTRFRTGIAGGTKVIMWREFAAEAGELVARFCEGATKPLDKPTHVVGFNARGFEVVIEKIVDLTPPRPLNPGKPYVAPRGSLTQEQRAKRAENLANRFTTRCRLAGDGWTTEKLAALFEGRSFSMKPTTTTTTLSADEIARRAEQSRRDKAANKERAEERAQERAEQRARRHTEKRGPKHKTVKAPKKANTEIKAVLRSLRKKTVRASLAAFDAFARQGGLTTEVNNSMAVQAFVRQMATRLVTELRALSDNELDNMSAGLSNAIKVFRSSELNPASTLSPRAFAHFTKIFIDHSYLSTCNMKVVVGFCPPVLRRVAKAAGYTISNDGSVLSDQRIFAEMKKKWEALTVSPEAFSALARKGYESLVHEAAAYAEKTQMRKEARAFVAGIAQGGAK